MSRLHDRVRQGLAALLGGAIFLEAVLATCAGCHLAIGIATNPDR